MKLLKHPLQAISRLFAAALFCLAVLASQLAHALPHGNVLAPAASTVAASTAEIAADHVIFAADDAAHHAKHPSKMTGDTQTDHCQPASVPGLAAEYHLDWRARWGPGWHVTELIGNQVLANERPPRA